MTKHKFRKTKARSTRCKCAIDATMLDMAMIAWAVAARGADMGDAESARAARINLLKDENAKMMRTLEKVRGAISHWAALGFVPGVGASSAEGEGPAAPAEPAGAPGPGRRLERKVPDGVKVWQGGVLHNFKNAETCPTAWSKCPPLAMPQLGSCACSAHALRLRVARHSQDEAEPLGAPPLPRGPRASRASFPPAVRLQISLPLTCRPERGPLLR